MDHFQPVLPLAQLPAGGMRTVTVNYQDVVLVHLPEGVFAIANACPHARGPLGRGALAGPILTCPWHNWTFDVRTGESPAGGRARTFPVRIVDGQVEVDCGPKPAVPPPPPIQLPEDM